MQRTLEQMIERLQATGNPVKVDTYIAADTCTLANILTAGRKMVAYSCTGGNVILADFVNDYGETVQNVPLASVYGLEPCQNITVIHKTGTDATGVVIWTL
jgi:hypothetical protein